jgi:hypothetical protein
VSERERERKREREQHCEEICRLDMFSCVGLCLCVPCVCVPAKVLLQGLKELVVIVDASCVPLSFLFYLILFVSCVPFFLFVQGLNELVVIVDASCVPLPSIDERALNIFSLTVLRVWGWTQADLM